MSLASIAQAVWEYSTRTLASGTPGSPVTLLDHIAQATWTNSTRTLTSLVAEIVDDARIESSTATTNYGASDHLATGTNGPGNPNRSLLRFDLGSIPSGVQVASATLRLTGLTADTWSRPHSLYELRAGRTGWTEAGVTWNTYDGTNNWGTAGAANTTTDRQATALVSFNTPASATAVDITIPTEAVERWLNGENYGLLLVDDSETAWQRTIFASSEHPTVALRPVLTVSWSGQSGGGENNPPDMPSIVSVTVLGGA